MYYTNRQLHYIAKLHLHTQNGDGKYRIHSAARIQINVPNMHAQTQPTINARTHTHNGIHKHKQNAFTIFFYLLMNRV